MFRVKAPAKPRPKGKRVVTQFTEDERLRMIKKHRGQFAATDPQGRIVAFGKTPASAVRQAHKMGEKDPTLFHISGTAYIFSL